MYRVLLLALLTGCPPASDTDSGLDTDPGSDTELDVDTDTDTTSSLRRDPGACEPWGSTPPSSLARTGCVDPADPSQPAAGFMPYTLVSPLWSDGATKARYVALPLDAQATVTDEGDIEFPVGTVLGKWFYVDDVLIEVRLFSHNVDGWAGASWQWDAGSNDGILREQGASVALDGGGTWSIPSTGQCRQCHTTAAGVSLGPQTNQLDIEWEWPDGTMVNALDAFVEMEVLPSELPDVPPLYEPFGDGPIEERARSYLHTNCAGCHQPGGGTPYVMDFRITMPLADADACGVDAVNALGMSDMQRIAPGDAEHSMVVQRMGNTTFRMPPVGSNVVDIAAVDLVTEWITSLDTCPETP